MASACCFEAGFTSIQATMISLLDGDIQIYVKGFPPLKDDIILDRKGILIYKIEL